MTEPRIACATPRCRNTILPTTAARTGGICRPCEQEIARAEHAAYIEANRREVDPFAGVTDPVEIARLLARPRNQDPLIDEKPFPGDAGDFFASLPPHDLARIVPLGETNETVAVWLAAFTDADLDRVQRARLDAGEIAPAIVFRGAAADVRNELAVVAEHDPANRDAALAALAWIGDDRVVELFARWRRQRPRWSDDLYVAPHEYTHAAGWELDADDRRRDLFLPVAHALVKGEGEVVVDVTEKTPGRCPSCRGPLTTLLRQPQRVVICVSCTTYGPSSKREPAPWEKPARLVLGKRRGIRHAAEPFLPTTMSQLGGLPGWLQNLEYPKCSGCARTMTFIAQVQVEDLEELGEGTFYVFWCFDCSVAATVYQQT